MKTSIGDIEIDLNSRDALFYYIEPLKFSLKFLSFIVIFIHISILSAVIVALLIHHATYVQFFLGVMTRAEFARFIDQSCDFNGKTANAQIKEFYEEHKDKMASIECREMFHFEDWKSFLSRKTLDSLDEKTKDACELNFGTESFNHQSNIYGMLIFDDENAAVHLKLIF